MMMEIVLSEEKAKQFNYPIERCYELLDEFLYKKGINKLDKGIYQYKEYGKMASAQVALPRAKWFMDIIETWYCRYASDDISAREDCKDYYLEKVKKYGYGG